MISVEMEDVLAVLQLCKPYIIGIVAALVIGIVIMTACRRMCRDKKFLIRREAAIAMVLAVVVCVNMICFGPMATLIGLATGNGTLSDETNEEDLITTTKKDSKNHGFGLKSIRTAVEKYDGSVVFGVQQNWFELKILLPRVL